MRAVYKGQITRPDHVFHLQGAIEMRKECAPPRRLPDQICSHAIGLTSQKHEPFDASKVLGGCFGGLGRGGEMHIAIRQIDGRAQRLAFGLQLRPFFGAEDFVYQHHILMPASASFVNGA